MYADLLARDVKPESITYSRHKNRTEGSLHYTSHSHRPSQQKAGKEMCLVGPVGGEPFRPSAAPGYDIPSRVLHLVKTPFLPPIFQHRPSAERRFNFGQPACTLSYASGAKPVGCALLEEMPKDDIRRTVQQMKHGDGGLSVCWLKT